MSTRKKATEQPAAGTGTPPPLEVKQEPTEGSTSAGARARRKPADKAPAGETPPLPDVKQEPALKSERLPSFREQRDLTLGGLIPARSSRSAANKKVFVPNLNVTRNKNVDVQTSRDTSAGPAGRGRGRGRADKAAGARAPKPSTLVQTSGLFSEGTGETRTRKSLFDRNAGAGDSASQLRRPTIVKGESARIDRAAERQNIREVLGSLLNDDDDGAERKADGLADGAAAGTGGSDADRFGPIALQTDGQAMRRGAYAESLEELFGRAEQQLVLVQLPDTLPGHGPDAEPAESAEAENVAAAKQDPFASFCTARQIDDGLVGRIVRRRSGRIQMILGELVFNLSLGIDPGWLQEIMSVQPNAGDRKHGALYNLGQVQAKLNVTPDWERLFAAKAGDAEARLANGECT